MSVDLKGIIDWLNGWFYRKEEVNTYLNAKANKNLTNANMNVVTDSSGNITTEAKPTIPDVSGKIDTAGTGLSKSGTTLNHSNSITAQTSNVFKKFKYDAQGHITGTANVDASDLPSHNHPISNITNLQTNLDNKVDKVTGKGLSTEDYTSAEKSKLANIEAEANKTVVDSALSSSSTNPVQNKVIQSALNGKANSTHSHTTTQIIDGNTYSSFTPEDDTQSEINKAIDTAIGDLSNIRAIEVVSDKGTASADKLGKLFIVSENSKVNVYYVKQSGTGSSATYSWEKMDTDILDELSIDWSDVLNNPFSSSTPSSFANASHNHGYINNDGTLTQRLTGSSMNGILVLNRSNEIVYNSILPFGFVRAQISYSNIGYDGSGSQADVDSAINTTIGTMKTNIAGKQNIGDCITSIELVPKSDDETGAIRLYYGDEE